VYLSEAKLIPFSLSGGFLLEARTFTVMLAMKVVPVGGLTKEIMCIRSVFINLNFEQDHIS